MMKPVDTHSPELRYCFPLIPHRLAELIIETTNFLYTAKKREFSRRDMRKLARSLTLAAEFHLFFSFFFFFVTKKFLFRVSKWPLS